MNRNHLGGLLAIVLAVSALGATTSPTAGAGTKESTVKSDSSANARAAARSLIAQRAPALKISAYDAFQARPVLSSAGVQYAPYERTYRGLKVVGGDFVVVTDREGQVLNTSVAQTRTIDLASTTAAVSAARARTVAGRSLDRVDRTTAAAKVVYALGTPRLAWSVQVAGVDDGERSVREVYVDARSGKVLGSRDRLVEGSGTAGYSGPNPLTLNTTNSSGTYSLKDPASTTRVCQDAANNTTYSGTDDAWGNGDPTNKETGCVDAFFGTQTMKSMMSSWLGRNGQDGNGGWAPLRVGLNDVNAYYCSGSVLCGGYQVQIGHSQSGGRWISSIDVVAHEYGHGVDDKTPGGISGSGTQEFVGDVFGALAEHFANEPAPYDVPDYLVGEEIDLVGQGPIRNMYNPSAVGDPNCYSSSIPNAEVHAAAGPGNHWFYLLAEGTNPSGKPASTTCNGSSNLIGIGIQKAGKIMYNAMLMKTTGASYLKYRTWTLTAAKNLYGTSTCSEFNAVKAAWNAVSVPAQTGDPTCTPSAGGVTVTNPGNKTGTVGTAISSFTVTASGGTSPYTWSASGLPAGVTIGSSSGTVSGTPTASGTYNVTVTATDSLGAAGSASFTFTISGGGGTCSAGQKLGNPGFETGTAAPWSATAGVIDSSTSQPARTGTWKAWLDGYGSSHTDTLTQSVTIPAGCTSATLSFYLHIDSAETTTSIAYDKLTVKIGTTTLATYSNLNKASGYVLRSFNVSSFVGQTVTISFSGVEDSSLQTSFVIDDTGLNVS